MSNITLPEGSTALIIEPEGEKPWRAVVTDSHHTILLEVPLVGANLEHLKAALAVDLHPSLGKYKVGERVDVLKHGDWVTGHITSKERGGSLIYVHTEKGPASVGSTRMIRKIL